MQRQWSSGRVQKTYLALVAGTPPDQWECHEPIGPGPHARYRIDHEKGRPAETAFETILRGPGAAEVRALPRTGRTHQIRLHAQHAGSPLLGDVRYGGPAYWQGLQIARTMLHATELQFQHPKTGQTIQLHADTPADYVLIRRAIEVASS